MKTWKRLFSLLLCAALLACALTGVSFAEDDIEYGSDGNITWTFNYNSGTLTFSGTGPMGGDGSAWHGYFQMTTSIVIEPGVTSVGDFAFSDFWHATSVTLPEGLTSIGYQSFGGCSGLTSLTLPDGLVSIDQIAFYYCTGLTSLTIPSSITTIGFQAFGGCSKLANVSFNGTEEEWNAVEVMGYNDCLLNASFQFQTPPLAIEQQPESCTAVIGEPATFRVSAVGGEETYSYQWQYQKPGETTWRNVSVNGTSAEYALVTAERHNGYRYRCRVKDSSDPVQTVYSNEVLLTVSAYPTGSCGSEGSSVTWVLFDDGSLTISGTGAMADYSADNPAPWYARKDSILSVIIQPGVTSVGDSAFEACTGLTDITLPDGVTSIGDSAFHECSALTVVTLPGSLASIGEHAFCLCDSLTDVYFIGPQFYWDNVTLGSDNDPLLNASFHLQPPMYITEQPASVTAIVGSKASFHVYLYGGTLFYSFQWQYRAPGETAWQNISSDDTSGVYTLTVEEQHNGYCYRCAVTDSSDPPQTVYTDEATLTVIQSVSGSCGSEGDNVTWSLDGTGRLVISGTGAMSDDSPWAGYSQGIKSVLIQPGVTSIGEWAFQNCTALTDVTLPDGLTSIGRGSFSGCEQLTAITLPDGLTSIGDSSFSGCEQLTAITLPDGLTSIGDGAFINCVRLRTITIPDSVTSIGSRAFLQCPGLIDGNGFVIVRGKLFDYYGPGGDVTIPAGVTVIDEGAFLNNNALTSVAIPSSVTSIRPSAFEACTELTDVYFLGTENEWNSVSILYSNDPIQNATIHFLPQLIIVQQPTAQTVIVGGAASFSISAVDGLAPLTYLWQESADGGASWTDLAAMTGGSVALNFSTTAAHNGKMYRCTVTDAGGRTAVSDAVLLTVSPPPTVDCGAPGAWVTWALDYTGTLTISGTGDMADYSTDRPAPWYEVRGTIASVVIQLGVTGIGECAFDGCSALTGVTLPDSLTAIGACAFRDCGSLTDVYFLGNGDDWNAVTNASDDLPFLNAQLHLFPYLKITLQPEPVSVRAGAEVSFRVSADYGVEPISYRWQYQKPGETTWRNVTQNGASEVYTLTTEERHNGYRYRCRVTDSSDPAQTVYSDEVLLTVDPPLTGSYGDNVTWTLDGSGTLTISGTGSMWSYSPSNIPWKEHRPLITSVIIQPGVTTVGRYAFSGCSNLTSAALPDGVTGIGYSAFNECTSLTSVTIPDSVTSIEGYAFNECASLTSVTIPDGVTSIENSTFFRCTSLTSAALPDSVTSIGKDAFFECRSLTSMTIPAGVTSIPGNTFNYCTSLTSVTIPEGVTSIGNRAFQNCTALTDVTIPDSVTSMGTSAFMSCKSLKSVTIPRSLTAIPGDAFKRCSSLTDVYFRGTEAEWAAIAFDSGNESLLYASIHFLPQMRISLQPEPQTVLAGAEVTFRASADYGAEPYSYRWQYRKPGESTWRNVSKNGTSAVLTLTAEERHNGYLYRCKVTDSSDPAKTLYSDEVLLTVNPPLTGFCGDNVTLTLDGTGVLIIGGTGAMADFAYDPVEGAVSPWYEYRQSVVSVVIQPGVTRIGANAFCDIPSLESVTLPDSLTSIGYAAFSGCSSLTDITFPTGLTSIDYSAFSGCSGLTSVVLPAGLTSIQGSVFYNCRSLTNVSIPEGVTSIGYGAFYDCPLTSVTIPEGVTSIGSRAFMWCTSLTSVTLPSSLATIGEDAFYGCDLISDVYFLGTEAEWAAIAFDSGNDPLQNASILFLALLQIQLQPEPQTVRTGAEASFRVTAAGGTAPYSYRWQYRKPGETTWRNVSQNGASASYTLTTEERHNGYLYRCKVKDSSDPVSTVYSDEVLLTVDPPFTGSCGANLTWALDGTGTLIISGTGVTEDYLHFDYPWIDYRPSIVSVVVQPGVTAIGYGAFQNCTALTSLTLPDSLVMIGDYAFCGCSGLTSMSIGSGLASIGAFSFYGCRSLTDVTYNGTAEEWAEVSIQDGNDLAWIASIRFQTKPLSLRQQPESQAINPGWQAVFSVTAAGGTEPYAYQWQVSENGGTSWADVPDDSGATWELSFFTEPEQNGNLYRCVVTDAAGSTVFSDAAELTVNPPPLTVFLQPSDSLTAIAGGTAVFDAAVLGGVEPYSYQWQYQKPGETTWRNVTANGTSAEYVLAAQLRHDGYRYRCRVTDSAAAPQTEISEEILLMVVSSLTGECGSEGGNVIWTLDSSGILTISGTGEMADYINQPPWLIHSAAFTSVVIQPGVTSIGAGAFMDCAGLTSVMIPDTVTSIGMRAFRGCGSLTDITIPDSVVSIGSEAFRSCAGLADPDGFVFFKGILFDYCGSDSDVDIPAGVTGIGDGVFMNRTEMTSVMIPDGVTSIGDGAFYGCTGLTSVMMADSVTGIGYGAFMDCSGLAQVFFGGDESAWTAISVAQGNEPLLNAQIEFSAIIARPLCILSQPSSVSVFVGAQAEFHVTVSEGTAPYTYQWQVSKNGGGSWTNVLSASGKTADFAFTAKTTHNGYMYHCVITDAAGVVLVSEAAALATAQPPTGGACGAEGANVTWTLDGSGTLTVSGTGAMIDFNDEFPPWYDYREFVTAIRVQPGVTHIGKYSFVVCKATDVTIGEGVTDIGNYAFGLCTELTGVTIPGSVTRIGEGAFVSCDSLTDVYYTGTESMWNAISIDFDNNQALAYASLHCLGPVAPAVAITADLTDYVGPVGSTASFTVQAEGAGLTYQWWVKSRTATRFSKSSVVSATYSVTLTEANSGRQLYCVVTDAAGNTAQTNTVSMTVGETPAALAIVTDLTDYYGPEGSTASFTVVASGEGLTYQWYVKKPTASKFSKSSITGDTYSVELTAARNGNQVYCVVTDAGGNTVQTGTVTMTIREAVSVEELEDYVGAQGSTATFTAIATGEGLTYQWWVKKPSATKFSKSSITGDTYAVELTAERNGNQVYCVVTDAFGNTVQTNTVSMIIGSPLSVAELTDYTGPENSTATFTVSAEGEGLTYQWYVKKPSATKFSKSSITGDTYSVELTAARNGNQVYCVVTDALGNTVQTNTVTMTIG